MKGEIKFYHDRKNYGFIETDEIDEDVFFHQEAVPEDLNPSEGVEVEFEVEEGSRGPAATELEEA